MASSTYSNATAVDLTTTDYTVPVTALGNGLQPTSGLYIGTAGDLTVVLAGQDGSAAVRFAAHPAGYAPLAVVTIMKAGTTASGIIALS